MIDTTSHNALKAPLGERILFLDGITRAGKKFACRIVTHFTDVDMFQFHSVIEHAAYLHFNGRIAFEDAAALIQYQTDEHLYNRAVGRNLNERADDETFVGKSPYADRIRERASGPSGPKAVATFAAENWLPFFHVHSVMPVGRLLFAAYPFARLIHMSRHPLDLVIAWLDQGWGRRELEDPTSFIPLFSTPAGVVPWYASTWPEAYLAGNEVTRAVEGVMFLQNADAAGYAGLDDDMRRQVLRLSLEGLTNEPATAIASLQGFLGRTPAASLAPFLAADGRPIVTAPNARDAMLERVAPHLPADLLARFAQHAAAYETEWNLPPSRLAKI